MLAGGELLLAHRNGNPVEIAAIVVWQVADTAKATYAVDNYQDFVRVQAESALRHVATTHPYDALSRLAQNDVVELDEERKASMASNLMVVLCGDQPPSLVVNVGSLYS